MKLSDILEGAAHAAQNYRIKERGGNDPNSDDSTVLMGYCYENARELSYRLFERRIPHQVIYGGIMMDFLANVPTIEAHRVMEETNIDIENYSDDEHGYDPSIWEAVPKPTTKDEIPDEINHYWIEVDETNMQSVDETDGVTWHVEIAAEARHKYGDILIAPAEDLQNHYIRPEDGQVTPWKHDDQWTWNPKTLTCTEF